MAKMIIHITQFQARQTFPEDVADVLVHVHSAIFDAEASTIMHAHVERKAWYSSIADIPRQLTTNATVIISNAILPLPTLAAPRDEQKRIPRIMSACLVSVIACMRSAGRSRAY